MDFGSALTALKSGAQVYRTDAGWRNSSCITLNGAAFYIGEKAELAVDFTRVWYPSPADLLANDWELV